VETAGLLLPVLLVPWSSLSSRGWATLFVLGAAQLAVGYAMGSLKRRRDASRGPRHAIQS
jgi:hypothetical protein